MTRFLKLTVNRDANELVHMCKVGEMTRQSVTRHEEGFLM